MITTTSFEVYHRDFEQMFILREINEKEDIEDWISLVSHSNIVTAIDQFFDDEISFKHF